MIALFLNSSLRRQLTISSVGCCFVSYGLLNYRGHHTSGITLCVIKFLYSFTQTFLSATSVQCCLHHSSVRRHVTFDNVFISRCRGGQTWHIWSVWVATFEKRMKHFFNNVSRAQESFNLNKRHILNHGHTTVIKKTNKLVRFFLQPIKM